MCVWVYLCVCVSRSPTWALTGLALRQRCRVFTLAIRAALRVGHTAGEPWGRAHRVKDLRWAREGAFKAASYVWADNDWSRWWGCALRPLFGPHPGLALSSGSASPMPVHREAGHPAGDPRGAGFCLQTSPLDERYALKVGPLPPAHYESEVDVCLQVTPPPRVSGPKLQGKDPTLLLRTSPAPPGSLRSAPRGADVFGPAGSRWAVQAPRTSPRTSLSSRILWPSSRVR